MEVLRPSASANFMTSDSKHQDSENPVQTFELEAIIGRALRNNWMEVMKAFLLYDVDKRGTITSGELRRILENFCCPMTTEQYNHLLTKMNFHQTGEVSYKRFLERFTTSSSPHPSNIAMRRSLTTLGLDTAGVRAAVNGSRLSTSSSLRSEYSNNNSKLLSASLQHRVKSSDSQFLDILRQRVLEKRDVLQKAFRMFDYNRDKRVKDVQFRKVLENYCQPISEEQFQRLCREVGQPSVGHIDYDEFLRQMTSSSRPTLISPSAVGNGQKLLTLGNTSALTGMNMDGIEVKFRAMMRKKSDVLYKVFRSFDTEASGFVSITDFLAVLNEFIFPMDETQLTEIFRRCNTKASSKIAWLTFLDKFKDPSGDVNGQTLPIRSNHKCNPIMGTDQATDTDTLLRLLQEHIIQHYASLKQAFLSVDKTRRGFITAKELRALITRYNFVIPKDFYPKLLQLVDPTRSGRITYTNFLQIFEQSESVEAHKWLQSVHRVNPHSNATLKDQKALQDLLREKLTNHWNQLSILTRKMDPRGEGFLSKKDLQRLFGEICFSLSNAQLDSLISQLSEKSCRNQKVNYLDLFQLLHVDGRPSDSYGLSSQVTNASNEARENRLEDHQKRMTFIEDNARFRTELMPIAEVLIRLQDRFRQHRMEIREAFKQLDREQKNFITTKNLRKVLNSYGLIMEDEQFQNLCQHLGLQLHSSIDYMLFVDRFVEADFTHSQIQQPCFLPVTNHKVNPVRGDEWSMSAAEAEAKIRQKLRENYANLRGAFHKFDDTNQGYLNKEDFRRFLDTFMCRLNDEEYEKLCAKLGLVEGQRLGYKQFLDIFEVRENLEEGHKWLVSKHRYNELKAVKSQNAADIIEQLPNKVHQNYNDVARAFCKTDSKGRGFITRREFAEMLLRMHFAFTKEEFKAIWSFYDVGGRGSLSYDDFLHRLKVAHEFSSGDDQGTSATIIQNSHQTVVNHLKEQKEKQSQLISHNVDLAKEFSAEQIQSIMKIRVRDAFPDVYTAFRFYDGEKKGFLVAADLERLLLDSNVILPNDQLHQVMLLLGLPDNKSQLTYEQFSKVLEDTFTGNVVNRSGEPPRPLLGGVSYEGLDPVKAEDLLRRSLSKQIDVLQRAFATFDRTNTGRISRDALWNVVKNFSGILSEQQFQPLLDKCDVNTNKMVDYTAFLNLIRSSAVEQDLLQLHPGVTAGSTDTRLANSYPLEQYICNELSNKSDTVLKTLKALDTDNTGLISQSDFRQWFHSHIALQLNDSEFADIWSSLPKYSDKLQWRQFVRKFVRSQQDSVNLLDIQSPINATPQEEERSKQNEKVLSAIDENRGGTAISLTIQQAIMNKWQDIFSECKSIAQDGARLEVNKFIELLRTYHVHLLPGELIPLLRRFGLRSSDKTFEYAPFLRSMLTTARLVRTEDSLDVMRTKLKTAGFPIHRPEFDSSESLPQIARIQQLLTVEWKAVRRQFRAHDPNNSGQVTVQQFDKIIKQFVSPLRADDFNILLVRFDPQKTGSIHYNDFIRVFLNAA